MNLVKSMPNKGPVRTTTNGKPAPASKPVKSGMGNRSKSVGGAYMKKSKRKTMKKLMKKSTKQ
jgi:hypothetical protein